MGQPPRHGRLPGQAPTRVMATAIESRAAHAASAIVRSALPWIRVDLTHEYGKGIASRVNTLDGHLDQIFGLQIDAAGLGQKALDHVGRQ